MKKIILGITGIIVVLIVATGIYLYSAKKNANHEILEAQFQRIMHTQTSDQNTDDPHAKEKAALDAMIFKSFSTKPLSIVFPNGGGIYKTGTVIEVSWLIANPDDIVRLTLIPGDITITSTANAAANFTAPYSWTIPSSIVPGNYKIQIQSYDQSGNVPVLRYSDTSDDYFTITN